ncbi:MAG: hypothetical protein LUO93_08520 [Methanomicrobiales archaeon]|nr:hypothetical protein [Methanomicrobiales archaeon]
MSMFFFFYLLIGFLTGLLIGDLFRDYRWVIPCAVGAVLPDLLDKPPGMWCSALLSTMEGSGLILSWQ